ncbi:MAG: ankyrin repeat domain-containing protein [Gemmatimonadota bacterium]|nr:ankyrin repeat domain-containing protein [Gemmatimonadota bacterium]
MTDHDALGALLVDGAWDSIIRAVTDTPELLEAEFDWAGQTLLHRAVIDGARPAIEALLDLGANVMARDRADNASPLHWAADRGDLEIVKLLVERGADPDARDDVHGWGPLGWATLGDMREDVARWLLEAGASPRIFPLIALDDGVALRELLATSPEVLDERMSKWEHYECPLHFAIGRGASGAFGALMDAGADIVSLNWVGLSPLAVAGFQARDEYAAALEEKRVEPDLSAALAWGAYRSAAAALDTEPGALAPKARYGRLLMYAAENDKADAARWLIENGADPNAVHDWWDNRLTALHPAASHGALETIRALVAGGADTAVRDEQFDAEPVEWARHFEQDAVVDFLEGLPTAAVEDE